MGSIGVTDRILLGRAAKVANQQMRRLEKAGYTRSPAYKQAQASLSMMGVKPTSSGSRRFPENYRAVTEEQYYMFEKAVMEMREYRTPQGYAVGTVKGFRQYYHDIYQAADRRYGLEKAGISAEAWFEYWSQMSDKNSDRVYGSDIYIEILMAYSSKYGDISKETAAEIAGLVNTAGNWYDALSAIGLTEEEFFSYGGNR